MADKSPAQLQITAAAALARGQWRAAAQCFEQVLETEPQSTAALMGKGQALVELGQVLEARVCFEDAAALGHPHAAAGLAECRKRLGEAGSMDWVRKVEALLAAGRYPEALASADEVLASEPNHETAVLIKGNACYGLGKHVEAIECYSRAIQLNPGLSRAWNNKGWLLLQAGEEDEALSHCTRATEIDPQYADAWMNKGAVLMEMCEFDQALECFVRGQSLGHPNATNSIRLCRELCRPVGQTSATAPLAAKPPRGFTGWLRKWFG